MPLSEGHQIYLDTRHEQFELGRLRVENQQLQDDLAAAKVFEQEVREALNLPATATPTAILARIRSLFKQWQAFAA